MWKLFFTKQQQTVEQRKVKLEERLKLIANSEVIIFLNDEDKDAWIKDNLQRIDFTVEDFTLALLRGFILNFATKLVSLGGYSAVEINNRFEKFLLYSPTGSVTEFLSNYRQLRNMFVSSALLLHKTSEGNTSMRAASAFIQDTTYGKKLTEKLINLITIFAESAGYTVTFDAFTTNHIISFITKELTSGLAFLSKLIDVNSPGYSVSGIQITVDMVGAIAGGDKITTAKTGGCPFSRYLREKGILIEG